ncbi:MULTISPECIES: hypothetical protein [Pseudovibrio]|uniref:hypothetical protein n=1 Tax=Stappiaceae TaxID=2821832 RepID=UPI0023664938|nr:MULTISPECIES: hypothetical protein [Pseudovibrio]MDD7912138.1 hypothetical protein [Pseudovibrio exalbescens]MDX5592868.1 hypothetical protein [Pseudovibrio sp. SPO723]
MTNHAFQRIDLPTTSEQDRAVQRIAEATHRVNEAVQRAVDLGLSVELIRVSRCHNGGGSYGDQVVPTIREKTNDQ